MVWVVLQREEDILQREEDSWGSQLNKEYKKPVYNDIVKMPLWSDSTMIMQNAAEKALFSTKNLLASRIIWMRSVL